MDDTKYLILIPCFNEEENIEKVTSSLKKNIDFPNYEILAINDGSSDNTLDILVKNEEINYVLSSNSNKGLANVFASAQKFFLERNFDFLIIYDCDMQYPINEISNLIYFSANSDIVIGCRNFTKNEIFSKSKNFLQILGSSVISYISGIKIPDVTSGFRLYNRHALELITITDSFTYTIESILQSKMHRLSVKVFGLSSFAKTRQSRLFNSNIAYLILTLKTLFNSLIVYREKLILKWVYLINFLVGGLSFSRFFVPFFREGSNPGNIQSLIFGSFIILSSLLLNILINQKIHSKKLEAILVRQSPSSHARIK